MEIPPDTDLLVYQVSSARCASGRLLGAGWGPALLPGPLRDGGLCVPVVQGWPGCVDRGSATPLGGLVVDGSLCEAVVDASRRLRRLWHLLAGAGASIATLLLSETDTKMIILSDSECVKRKIRKRGFLRLVSKTDV